MLKSCEIASLKADKFDQNTMLWCWILDTNTELCCLLGFIPFISLRFLKDTAC